jgi:hypothetical protein
MKENDIWKIVLITEKYTYWQHKEGYYNCSCNNKLLVNNGGYWVLDTLRKYKNDFTSIRLESCDRVLTKQEKQFGYIINDGIVTKA